jgi:DNA-binding Xre family transcriptional regulator
MLTWNLKPIFKARGIERPYTFLIKAGISRHTATSLLGSNTIVIRLSHLELLCEKLNCTPHDFLQWKPNPSRPLPQDHQLNKLKKEPIGFDLSQTLKTLPLEKLNEIASIISSQNPINNPDNL